MKMKALGVALYVLAILSCSHKPYVIKEPPASTRFLGIDREEVKETISKHTKEIKECYFKELDRTAEPEGKIVVQFEIGENGKVLNTQTISTTFKTRQVEECTIAHLKTWKFPAPLIGDTAIVSYPFKFKAEE